MWQIVLGSFGFLLYFIYDINSIRKKNVIFQKFFAVGTVFVVVSLLMELLLLWGQCQHRIGRDDRLWNRSRRLLCTAYIHLVFASL